MARRQSSAARGSSLELDRSTTFQSQSEAPRVHHAPRGWRPSRFPARAGVARCRRSGAPSAGTYRSGSFSNASCCFAPTTRPPAGGFKAFPVSSRSSYRFHVQESNRRSLGLDIFEIQHNAPNARAYVLRVETEFSAHLQHGRVFDQHIAIYAP